MKIKNLLFLSLLFIASVANGQYRFAGKVMDFSREYNSYPKSWCGSQALGEPNVYPQYDDIDGAWVAKNYGKQRDTLILGFDNNSPIDSILIWETSGAGIIDTVYIKNPSTGKWVYVFGRKGKHYPKSADTMARILRIGFTKTSFNVNEVRIELANDSAKDWSEIDAVAIHTQTLTPTTYSNLAGNSVSFDGKDDYYRTNFSTWNLNNKDKFSIMGWLKVDADTAPKVSTVSKGAGVIYDANYLSIGLTLANLGTGDSLYAFLDGDDYSKIAIPYAKNVWQHVAMVNTKDSLFIYINGNFYGKTTGSGFDSLDAFGLMEFGRNYDYKSYFKGELDEVKFYNRALTAAEVLKQKYTIGDAAVNANLVGYWQFNQNDSAHWNTYTHRTDSLHNGGTYLATGTILSATNTIKTNLRVYPNPNKGTFMLQIPESTNHSVSITVSEINGKVIFTKNIHANSNQISIELPKISKGIYYLKSFDGNTNGLAKIVVE